MQKLDSASLKILRIGKVLFEEKNNQEKSGFYE